MDAKNPTCTSRCSSRDQATASSTCVETDGPILRGLESFIPDSAKKVADWTYPYVCGNCTEPKYK